MPEIKRLSSELIGQIAAGEVVERPASAVKELVENSIDAGATNVTVELREGGIRYLRVSDNGRGIPAEQLRLAFERHATSKLSKADDLYNLHTLGFRGEALASIAAVSKVTCTTRTESAAFGTRAIVEAGEFLDIRQAASPVGTTLVVENLFENAPVRLKFLKKPALEAGMVSDYMLRLILSRPDISFRFASQGKTVYRSMGDGSVESALFCLYGKDALSQMTKVSGHMSGVLLSGYVGVGELARGNRQQQSLFINGRYFRSALLSRALEKGCEGRVMIGRFPMCALFLQVPCQQVDVNVHPNKLEVRFQNEAAVAEAVETLVREAMRGKSLSETLSARQPEPATGLDASGGAAREGGFVVTPIGAASEEEPLPAPVVIPAVRAGSALLNETVMPRHSAEALLKRYGEEAAGEKESLQEAEGVQTASVQSSMSAQPVISAQPAQPMQAAQPVCHAQSESAAKPQIPLRDTPSATPASDSAPQPEQTALPMGDENAAPLRLAGIVFDTYWIFESGDRLLLVDQHAAHERILYDRMMARFEGERISQRLLSPQLVRLTAREMADAAELAPLLREAGFEIEPFDERCIAVHAIPTLFGENEPARELLLEALAECQEGRGQPTRERVRKRVAQMACKRAIKGGDKLSAPEIEGFLREMLQSDAMPTCPHGRPIVTEITRYALEKRFKRVQ